ncbi:transmembrane amino acid transporter protein-domain-containing protein [Umbelopsis sp. AD052]|nr:transmembrane amino acid transporter protein-domain-containing protein [Umbelopsis sp. AD052]
MQKDVNSNPTVDVDIVSDSSSFDNVDDPTATRSHGGSLWHAYVNIVCIVAGTGALSLPYALKQGGWIGILILFLAWFMSITTGRLLVKCLYAGGPKRLSSYKDIGTVAFGPIGGWVIFFFNFIILIGASILYFVLIGQNLYSLLKGTPGELTLALWVIIPGVAVAIPFIFIKSMKEVAFTSAIGAFATLAVVLIVLISSLQNLPTGPIEHDDVIWDQFPVALSTIAFSFAGNMVYPNVERSMKNPQQWNKAVTLGLSSCSVMYFLTAVPGYYIYGTTALSPVYNNLANQGARMASQIIITIHVLLAVPILLTSLSLDFEAMFGITQERRGKTGEFVMRASLRVIIMIVVCVVAIYVPYFGDLLSLIGSFSNCLLVFTFPVVCYLKLTGVRNKPIYMLAWYALTVLLGIVGLIFGTIDAVKALISDFQGAA